MHATRQGFRWWQVDITYLGLRVLAALRVISDLRPVPPEVLEAVGRRRSRAVASPTS
jgi:stearoyl-CoA desaturase (delta-9 desaturase)